MPDDQQIQHLTQQIENLSSEVAQLRERVAQLEHGAGLPALHGTRRVAQYPAAAPVSAAAPPGITGLKLLNRAGALTLFIGIIFFFKYAVDNEWIGAAGRVVLGVVVGLVLLGAGEWLRKHGQTVFAQGVSACGVATIYISAYAACSYYKLINPASAFIAFVAISAGALLLSLRSSDVVLAIVGYLGAVAAPGLFRVLSPNVWTWVSFVYLFVLQVLVLIQAGGQFRRLLPPLTAAAITIQTFWVINPKHPIVCVLFFFALAALHFRSPKAGAGGSQIASDAYVLGHIFVLLAGMRFLVFWFTNFGMPETRSSLLSEAGSIFLGIYGVLLLISAVLRRSTVDRIIGLALLGVVIGKLYVVDVWLLTRVYRISAFVALGLLLLVSSYVYSRWKQRSSGA